MTNRTNNDFHTQNTTRGTLVAVFASALSATPALSAEFCVMCSAPDAIYRCAASREGVLVAPPGAQLTCIRELARQGGHKSCAITRQPATACDGRLLIVSVDENTQIPADHPINATEPDTANPIPPDETAASEQEKPATSGEPRTVQELAEQTVESSKKGIESAGEVVVDTAKQTGGQIKNAGDYVATGAKNTWTCITSLFSDCGGDE